MEGSVFDACVGDDTALALTRYTFDLCMTRNIETKCGKWLRKRQNEYSQNETVHMCRSQKKALSDVFIDGFAQAFSNFRKRYTISTKAWLWKWRQRVSWTTSINANLNIRRSYLRSWTISPECSELFWLHPDYGEICLRKIEWWSWGDRTEIEKDW